MTQRQKELLRHERRLWREGLRVVAGVDEAGRGPLAGPVVAAAVVIQPFFRGRKAQLWQGIDDSKRLSAKARLACYERIMAAAAAVGLGVVSAADIDRLNIYAATVLAMEQAVADAAAKLKRPIDYIMTDAVPLPGVQVPQTALVRGDSLSLSIAAASIVAKVHRDRLMEALDAAYPLYGFAQHKGYPTKAHREALRQYGPCPEHRRSFRWDGPSAPEQATVDVPGGA